MGLLNPPEPGSLLKAPAHVKAIDPPKKKEPGASKPSKEKDSGKKAAAEETEQPTD